MRLNTVNVDYTRARAHIDGIEQNAVLFYYEMIDRLAAVVVGVHLGALTRTRACDSRVRCARVGGLVSL